MDNITHTMTGLFLSRAGLNRFTPAAMPILLVSANLPDFDILSGLAGALSYLHWHRHLTHSLFLAPLLAFAVAGVFSLVVPKVALLPAAAVAFCGILSHILLDLTNIYGVRLLLPFRNTWFHWDLTPVIDFWIWTALLIAVAGPILGRIVTSEISGRNSPSNGRSFAVAALLFLVLYNGGRALIHDRVQRIINSRVYEDAPTLRVAAFPYSSNPLHWRGLAETSSSYHVFDFQLPMAFDPSSGNIVTKVAPSPALETANKTEAFRVFNGFAQYPWYSVSAIDNREGTQRVQLSDLRFDFTSTAILDPQGKVQSSIFEFGSPAPR